MFFELRVLETDRAIGANIVLTNKAFFVEAYFIWAYLSIGVGTPPDEQ